MSGSPPRDDQRASDTLHGLGRIAEERAAGPVYPPPENVFAAFEATPFEAVKVVLLGQDPYHGDGEAHGMGWG